jgi:hypothetical protein
VNVIYKYAIGPGVTIVEMPSSAQPLCAQMQGITPMLWALVDGDEQTVDWHVRCYGTGHPLEDYPGQYVGTFQMGDGALVWHVFAKVAR